MSTLDSFSSSAWQSMKPEVYHKAVYSSPLLCPVYYEELRVVQEYDWTSHCLIEVGSGPGEFLLSFSGQFSIIIGIERSERLIEQAKRASVNQPSVHHILGDAIELNQLLKNMQISELGTHPKLVCCVMNTLGILEPDTRFAVLAEIAKLLENGDSYMLTVFNRAYFADAIRDFYQANPELCGRVEPHHYNIQSGDLRVDETGYYSHWFDLQEFISLLTTAGLRNFQVRSFGVALFALGGRLK